MKQEKRMCLEDIINKEYANTAGILVLKEGKKVYEAYFNGCHKKSTIHVASATKSIFSSLIGIAIEEGFIKSIDQKILDFFPDYEVPREEEILKQITIRHMLTMTTPYKCEMEPFQEVLTSDNWLEPALGLIGGKDPIGTFRYSPMIGTHILSGVLHKAIGQSILDYAKEKLFEPLGITPLHDISLRSEAENWAFLESKDACGWVVDPQGNHAAAWGLTLSCMDLAKIGQLYLNRGMWNGKQLVPKKWIEDSIQVHSTWEQMHLNYGYLWWIIDRSSPSYAAMGDGGNVIYVNEEKKIVIAMTGLYQPEAKDRIELIKEYIEPMLEDEAVK